MKTKGSDDKPLTDEFGRPVQFKGENPFAIKSDRVGNQPDAVNNAILTKGWLRIESEEFNFRVPQKNKDDENGDISKEPLSFQGKVTSQDPINFQNSKQSEALNDTKGLLINPLWQEGNTSPVPCKTCFQFRLSGLSFQFTQLKEDMTVIGHVAIKSITNVNDMGQDPCMVVETDIGQKWKVCASSATEKQEWYCALGYAMRKPCNGQGKQEKKGGSGLDALVGTYNIIQPEWILPMASPWCNENWNYNALGTDWQCRCWDGQHQSPIDLPSTERLESISMGADIEFWKADAELVVDKNFVTLVPVDQEKGFGLMTSYIGDVYRAVQVIFHQGSDHTINGYRYELEAQIIYKSDDPTKAGKKAMVSVLFHTEVDEKNPVLERFVWDLPNGHNEYKGDGGIDLSKMFVNKNADKNAIKLSNSVKFNYQLYGGSLPFPPCDENVWVIVKQESIGIANQYIEMFKKVRDLYWSAGRLFRSSNNWRGNFRLPKKSEGRKVQYVKNGECDLDSDDLMGGVKGHWEKVEDNRPSQLFIDQEKASGLPGAQVISGKEVGK